MKDSRIFQSLLRYVLAIFFLYVAINIGFDLEGFQIKLYQSELISNDLAIFLSYIVPSFQLLLSFLLFMNTKLKEVLMISLVFLVVVTFYLLALNEFSLFNGCSCGGVFDELTYSQHLFVNVLVLIINFVLVLINEKKRNYFFKKNI